MCTETLFITLTLGEYPNVALALTQWDNKLPPNGAYELSYFHTR